MAPASAPQPSWVTPRSDEAAPATRGNGDNAPAVAGGRISANENM